MVGRGAAIALVLASLSSPAIAESVAQGDQVHWRFRVADVEGATLRSVGDLTSLSWDDSRQFGGVAPNAWEVGDAGALSWTGGEAFLPQRQLAVAAWVRVDAFPDWSGIFSALQDNGGFEQGLFLGLQGFRFTLGLAGRDSGDVDGTLTYLTAGTFARPGLWTFVCGTYDGRQMRLFINGEQAVESAAQRGAVWYPDDLTVALGGYVDSNETHPLRGALGELWIASADWSATRVRELYRSTRDAYALAPAEVVPQPWAGVAALGASDRVGEIDRVRVATAQYVQPAGASWVWQGRPVDLALSPDGAVLATKDDRGVGLFGAADWQPLQFLPFPNGGGSMHGLAFSADGERLWATTAQASLFEARRSGTAWAWAREISLPGPGGSGASHATGIAEDSRARRLWVCLSRNNSLGAVDLDSGRLVREIPVGVAPFDVVLLEGGASAIVSNWGGRRPRAGERSAPSSDTPVLVDERGIASSGTVGLVDLDAGVQVKETATGLHPADLVLDRPADRVYVANANSDTVTILVASTLDVVRTLPARPDPALPYGSATNALALAPDRLRLYAANGGNNAVAVFAREAVTMDRWQLQGFVPAAWYPSAVVATADSLFVANTKGLGSRSDEDPNRRHVKSYTAVVSKVAVPGAEQLADWTARVRADSRVPAALRRLERSDRRRAAAPVPVPRVTGEPSLFRHVVYVIKENRTYDQVFGDLPQGNGAPDLCIFPRRVTPNHHRLAEQFVLLDNFYCNGVNSADGHSWATEGNVTDHLEKSFGGFTRSYTFGDDPLTYSSTGFVWDNVLLGGLSFRNYGEMDYAAPVPSSATFKQIYDDFKEGKGAITFEQKIGIETLRRYSCRDYPGWNMRIPDVLRAERFLAELRAAEQSGEWYDFMIVFLPQDHTSGLTAGMPTPEAHMADNDLALGRIVEGISNSRFWQETCIFVIEDDPQAGFDHVDGHRSLCLVASPYTKRGALVSEFYNQTSVLLTMQRILGLPPMNQMDAASPLMDACFTAEIDLRPYQAVEPEVALDELAMAIDAAPAGLRPYYAATSREDFEGFDRADEDSLNRILWHAIRGPDVPYPAELAGAHGKGLAALGLSLTGGR